MYKRTLLRHGMIPSWLEFFYHRFPLVEGDFRLLHDARDFRRRHSLPPQFSLVRTSLSPTSTDDFALSADDFALDGETQTLLVSFSEGWWKIPRDIRPNLRIQPKQFPSAPFENDSNPLYGDDKCLH
jgi:hypothetical protein